jgi:Cysteine rich repeat
MSVKFTVAALAVTLFTSSMAAAVETKHNSHADSGALKGTAQEESACSPDAARFCSDAIPDNLAVLACLKDHRDKLKKSCKQVLEDHGQ